TNWVKFCASPSIPRARNQQQDVPLPLEQESRSCLTLLPSTAVGSLITKAGQDAPVFQAGEEWPFLAWGRGGWFPLPENTPMQAHRHSHRLAVTDNSRSHRLLRPPA